MNSDLRTYLVKLTPLEDYFFGSVKKGELSEKSDYYVKSKSFPNQTGLLGMIRYELLRQNKCLLNKYSSILDRDKAVQLVGEKGFDPSEDKQTFGVIHSLSPVFLVKDNVKYHQAPFNHNLEFSIDDTRGEVIYGPKSDTPHGIPILRHLEGYPIQEVIRENSELFNSKENQIINTKNVFYDLEKIGIKKEYSGESREDAYYKKVYKRMNKGFSFAFYLTLNNGVDYKFGSAIIRMGGEQSVFRFDIKEEAGERSAEDLYKGTLFNDRGNFIYLASDMNANNIDLSTFDFSISDSVVLKGIVSSLKKTESFYNLSKAAGKNTFPWLYKAQMLIKRGSIFYYDKQKKEMVKNLLRKAENEKPQFKTIGYNYFKIYSDEGDV